ncbi:ESX secretion-associated protein EspG [Rhodococcus triatomae]|uniref:EspG family protein n=1 Tax=Rhodococcus triatomae TaxID=300028 RepID=A0A1G8M9F6_9NOCA|nr:ESX secretion-associated protein EspG [Rhodococcus triatomae]QNG18157.1 ESX secretion-associated protein EspG [Rhodococcus triatomae]QNG22173.1 ESX secretion-associated protein EspG [Rhodococcus triatomae]SDI64574.1 EspG family protein [Rhodococcus triatomae]
MIRNWQIRGDQFGALWHGAGQDRSPLPFSLVGSARTHDAHEREQEAIRAAFAVEEREGVRDAVRVLADPEVYVEISGETVDERPLRIIGAQVQRWSAVAVQLPGSNPEVGGDVVLGAGITDDLAPLLIGVIPQNAGGSKTFARNDEPEPDHFSGSVLQSAGSVPAAPRFEDAVRAGYAGRGTIRVFRGPRHTRADLAMIRWFDLAGDGRYMIGPSDPHAAVPAGPRVLVDTLSTTLRRGIRVQREMAEQRW